MNHELEPSNLNPERRNRRSILHPAFVTNDQDILEALERIDSLDRIHHTNNIFNTLLNNANNLDENEAIKTLKEGN